MIEVSVEPRQLAAGQDCDVRFQFRNAGAGTCTDVVFKLGLPAEFLLLRGRNRVEIAELGTGQTFSYEVTVRARQPGTFKVTSPNFSYRNEFGSPVRVADLRAELTVVPSSQAAPPAGPGLSITLASGELMPGEWDVVRFRLRNTTAWPMRRLNVTIGGPLRIAPPGPQARIAELAARTEAEVSYIVYPIEAGRHVPTQLQVGYDDRLGRSRSQSATISMVVRGQSSGPPVRHPEPGRGDTILYLAASPRDLPLLRSDKEMREIGERLQLGKYRDRFRLQSVAAARLKDIGQALADYDPRIVHFSGHGERDGSLYVEDEMGSSVPAAPQGLAALFRLHATTLDCVIVNACHTLVLAEAVQRHIAYVVGMRCAIGDDAAITFSIGFYQGLAAGATVPQAFQRGCAFLQAEAVTKPEHETPVLLAPTGMMTC